MAVYACMRKDDCEAGGGPYGSAAELGQVCSGCGAEVYTDPISRELARSMPGPFLLICNRCLQTWGPV